MNCVAPTTCLEESCLLSKQDSCLCLAPAQKRVADELSDGLRAGSVCVLRGSAGSGKTMILRYLEAALKAACVNTGAFMDRLKYRSPAALEETFVEVLEEVLQTRDVLFVDDFHLLTKVVQGYDYPRANLLNAAIKAVLSLAEQNGKKLLFAVEADDEVESVRDRAMAWRIGSFEAEDFEVVCRNYLGESARRIDFDKVYRSAPALNGYQLKNACLWLGLRAAEPDTQGFLDYLSARNCISNVDLDEVQPVTWNDLKGADDVIEALEAQIAFPLENGELASKLQLKAKRGVLLAGPPGTGKTTIGRALAHRLKGKFFLIDGTVNADSGDFYDLVKNVFEQAKRNAPSVVFIDDADVIFEDKRNGLYRYLLTMIDGLESASLEQVCVILTAMDANALPAALLRSGRVELWLRTRLPDHAARASIWRERLSLLPPPLLLVDAEELATLSSGLSGADLKSAAEEGKVLFAYASTQGLYEEPAQFFRRAIQERRKNRQEYGRQRRQESGLREYGFPNVEVPR